MSTRFWKASLVLLLLLGAAPVFTSVASANVANDQNWQSNFYGPYWGTERIVKCPDGSVVAGLAGKDAENWISAGLKFYCQPILSISDIGNSNKSTLVIKDSTYWWWASWSSDVNCNSAMLANGLRIQQAFDDYANYIINVGLICSNFPNQSSPSATGYYGPNEDRGTEINCPFNYWLTGVSIKEGWGLDGLRAICSTLKNLDNFEIISSAGLGGTITPLGTSQVQIGSAKTYLISPSNNYQISNVKIDGVSLGVINTYTFSNVQSAHTIEAIFTSYNGNKQSTSGSCNSASAVAVTKSNGQGATNNAATFCTATVGPKK